MLLVFISIMFLSIRRTDIKLGIDGKMKGVMKMMYSKELEEMSCVAKGVNHGPAPIPEEGKWVKAKEIKDISGLTHGIRMVCTTTRCL